MDNVYSLGYSSNSLASNPFWVNYPKETSEEDKINAWKFVDGYVDKIIDESTDS